MTRATVEQLGGDPRIAAFLDALAWGETSAGSTDFVYCTLFGKDRHFGVLDADGTFQGAWPVRFPIWPGVMVGDSITHAAGRYQFEPETWRECQGPLNLPDFGPVSQDCAAWWWAAARYKDKGWDLLGDLQSVDGQGDNIASADALLSDLAMALHAQWTSLSPDLFPTRYRQRAALVGIAVAPPSC